MRLTMTTHTNPRMQTTTTIANPEHFRAEIGKRLDSIIQNEVISTNVELGIFNYVIRDATARKITRRWNCELFVTLYMNHLKSIMMNLTPHWVEQLNAKLITPHHFASMTHQELCPDKWAHIIDKKIKRDKCKYEIDMEASTTLFTCKKCKQNKCTYYQMQTRSADEPMTVFVSCLNCSARWRC